VSGTQVVVISGAAGGIGAALARRWAREGARVALLDREDSSETAAAVEAAGGEALAIGCDVTDAALCAAAIAQVLDRWGAIDVLIANAGITHLSSFGETDPAVLARVMAVNVLGAFHITRPALESLLARRGLVIVVSSVAGFAPLADRCGYAASKHALHGLFETLRAETLGSGLDVMMVCPSFTLTDIEKHALGGSLGADGHRARRTWGRQATPGEVADAVFEGARRRRRLLVLSATGKLSFLLSRVWPAAYERAMLRRMRRDG
jgi:NAD(P)-dependent dehydrogenase (short-subunit alcohol dehydrogenase family)